MSLNNIIKTLESEYQKEIENIDKNTNVTLKKLEQDYTKKLGDSRNEILSRANSEAQRTADLHLFAEQTELKKKVLRKKRMLIEGVYKNALNKLSQMSDQEYQKIIVALLRKLPDQSGIIIPAKGREKVISEAIKMSKGKFQVSSDTVESAGGFIWYSEKMNIDNTFEQLIRMNRENSEIDIANELFKNE